jgi:Mg2+ and Co2+ transporter CorA
MERHKKHLLALTDDEEEDMDIQFLDEPRASSSESEKRSVQRLLADARDIQRKVAEQQLQFKSETSNQGDVASQLSKTRQHNLIMARRWEQCQEEVDRCHEQIAKQASQNA